MTRIESFAGDAGDRWNGLLLAAWYVLLSRHTTPEASRNRLRRSPGGGIEAAVGFVAKYLPVTGRLEGIAGLMSS